MKFLRLLFVPFAALVVLAARLGLPLRFGAIWSGRMGHMAGNMECYLCERAAGISRGWDFWYHNAQPCSRQLARMLARAVRIDRTGFVRVCALVNQLFTDWERHSIDTVQVDRDPLNLYEKYPPYLRFTPREHERGHAGLRKLGIPHGAQWVYLIVRDEVKHPHLPYHSYRNADIATYEPAALALAERGYYVVRVGAKVAKKMGIIHPRIIDFASLQPYDDFMAIYLGAHCAFCITSGTGPDAIPVIFRRPVCYTNYVPIEYLQTYHRRSLAIWKHHEKDGKRMTPAEIYASGAGHFLTAGEFADAGITLVDNTPEEITEVALEMANSYAITGWYSYGGRGSDIVEQDAFWRDFPRGVDAVRQRPLHGEIRMRIGTEFLRGYQ